MYIVFISVITVHHCILSHSISQEKKLYLMYNTTCVGSQMSFEVGTLEVCLFTSWETADIVAPAREVRVCGGPTLVWGYVDWCRSQGEELGVANSHNVLLAWRSWRHWGLRDDKHDRALSHWRTYQKRLWERGGLGKDGLRPSALHLNMGLNNGRDDSSLPIHRKYLAENWAGHRRLRHGRRCLWCSGVEGACRVACRSNGLKFCSRVWSIYVCLCFSQNVDMFGCRIRDDLSLLGRALQRTRTLLSCANVMIQRRVCSVSYHTGGPALCTRFRGLRWKGVWYECFEGCFCLVG